MPSQKKIQLFCKRLYPTAGVINMCLDQALKIYLSMILSTSFTDPNHVHANMIMSVI